MVPGIAVPPAFEYLPQVFAADPHHRAAVAMASAADGDVVSLGDQGRTAAQEAREFKDQGCRRVVVYGGPYDEQGMEALAHALREHEIEVELSRVQGTDEPSPWLLTEVPDESAARELLDRLVQARAEPGGEQLRLSVASDIAPDRGGGAPWAGRLRLRDPRWRAFLTVAIERAFPQHAAEWRAVCLLCDHGLSPLAEMYAGNALPDRNAELLLNIVDEEDRA